MSVLNAFRRNNRGNVATLFAISLIPLVGAVGAAIDYSRIAQARTKLADALDAGLLAVGSQAPMSETRTYAAVKQWVDAHMDGIPYSLDSVDVTDSAITGKASTEVEMTLARILGVERVPLSVTSQALRSLGKVEIALVLDNTGSMKGTKIATLRDAAAELVDTLASATANPNDLRMALVPFSMTVNVSPQYNTAPWIDTAGKSPIADQIFTSSANRLTLFNQMNTNWAGCVESRPYPYDVDITAPTSATPATLYVPFFAPDEPDSGGAFYNNYLADYPGDRTFTARQGNPSKYTAPPRAGTSPVGYQYGPNAGCELAPIQRLSSNTDTVKTAIKAMKAVGDTNIPMGLHWGWNVLAPKGEGPFGDGVVYGDGEWTKVVVLMTDGLNQNTGTNNSNDSFYSGVGYIWQGRIGVGAGSSDAQRRNALDDRLAELCKNMKAAGKKNPDDPDRIVIYTVRVEVKTGSSAVLQDCASDASKFYDVQNVSQLVAVFKEIGGSIQKLRLAQ